MEKLILKSSTFIIPASIEEITVEHYQQIERYLKDKEIPQNEIIYHILAVLLNRSYEFVMSLNMTEFNTLHKIMNILKGLNEMKELIQSFKMDGVTYYLNTDFKSLTFGEFSDLMTLSKDVVGNLHIIMAILYRPAKSFKKSKFSFLSFLPFIKKEVVELEDYDANKVQATALLIRKKVSIKVCTSFLSFFLFKDKKFLKALTAYSTTQAATTTM